MAAGDVEATFNRTQLEQQAYTCAGGMARDVARRLMRGAAGAAGGCGACGRAVGESDAGM